MVSRLAFFVDGANVPQIGLSIDLVRLLERLSVGRNLVYCNYYCSKDPGRLTATPDSPLMLKVSTRKVPRSRKKRERIDLQMSVDLVGDAYENYFDVAVLVTGDSDYQAAISRIRDFNKRCGSFQRIEAYGFRESFAPELMGAVDHYDFLNNFRRDIRMVKFQV